MNLYSRKALKLLNLLILISITTRGRYQLKRSLFSINIPNTNSYNFDYNFNDCCSQG